ncbi:Nonsense-mediated decay protein Upf3 [Plasmopara halstedii]|uniref:Nonsense-mediated decay protein Upf3 n=1 Tax=Plasmopara halstedii TaxID=4781 RepID=A0A0P1B6V8_PLAHL|nr:Nonsense-mediated decay protein Upf3 [Plasmopara halstedii]CEG50032.1 Nonsense-mediated decay protein Upf3 [Plasmopara halstedii]|eukprot:XP_024586401.1 Nonsense-mediated decay protein Upf3 [Plasmopara halstedii]
MTPPPRRGLGKGRGRGGRGGERDQSGVINNHISESSTLKLKKRERGNSSNKRGGGRGSGASSTASSSSATSARPTRAVTTVLKKVVVRNIPPTASESEARELLQAHGVSDELIWRFVPGLKRSKNRPSTPARLYLDMKHEPESARKLIASLHGQFFYPDLKDQGGFQPLDVEFAPFQKIPREKQRKDAKDGMLDRDPEYIAFLEDLAKPKDKLPSVETLMDMVDGETVEKPVAALVKYMNERKAHIRDKGKGKSSAKSLDKSGRRQKEKIDGSKQKGPKDKAKSAKDRQKKRIGETGTILDSISRKQRGKNLLREDVQEAYTEEAAQPGSVHIMTQKKSAAATPAGKAMGVTPLQNISLDSTSETLGPKVGKKSGGRGRINSKKGKDGGEKAEGPSRTDVRHPSRRKGEKGGKKESTDKLERKKKVFAPKDATAQGTPAKS